MRHLSEATRRRIGRSAVIAAFVAAGVFVVLADPTGVSAVMAGLLLTILRLAAALFPDYFKDMEDCVYLGFQSLVKVLQDLPHYMKQLKQKLKEAWASAWSTFCAGVRNLWDRFKGVWPRYISRENAKQQLEDHFKRMSKEQYEELLLASHQANSYLQSLVDQAVQARQRMSATTAA